MGLGILEPCSGRALALVPGTATLLQGDEDDVQEASKSAIILVPKPSNSPRDPLVGTASRYCTRILAYAPVELAIMEKRPCLACNVPFHHGRRNPRFLTLDCKWDLGPGVWTAYREDRESVVVPTVSIRRDLRRRFRTCSYRWQASYICCFN